MSEPTKQDVQKKAQQSQQILAAINGALAILDNLVPVGEQLLKGGEQSVEDQQGLADRIQSIRDGSAFSGSQWRKSTEAPPS